MIPRVLCVVGSLLCLVVPHHFVLPFFRSFPFVPGPPRLLSPCPGVPPPAFLALGCLGRLSVLPLLVVSLGDVAVGLGQVLGGPLDPVPAARGYCLLVFPDSSLDVVVVGPDGIVLLVLALPLLRPAFLLALVLLGDSVVGRARAVGASAGLSLLFVPSLVPRAAALLLLPGVGVAGMAV